MKKNSTQGRRAKRQRPCSVPGCGRKPRARGLCITHYEQQRTTGTVRAIHPMRAPRKGTVRLAGRSVTVNCAEQLSRYAAEHGWSVTRTITELVERWAKRQRRPPRH